jgi:hypothetical protein
MPPHGMRFGGRRTAWWRSDRPTPERAGMIEGSANEQCSRKANCCRAQFLDCAKFQVSGYRAVPGRPSAPEKPPRTRRRPRMGRRAQGASYSSPPTGNSNTSPRTGSDFSPRPGPPMCAALRGRSRCNQTSEESRAQGFSSRVTGRQECLRAGQRATCMIVRTADPADSHSGE